MLLWRGMSMFVSVPSSNGNLHLSSGGLKFGGQADGLPTWRSFIVAINQRLLSPSCVFLQVPEGRSQQTARQQTTNNTHTHQPHSHPKTESLKAPLLYKIF